MHTRPYFRIRPTASSSGSSRLKQKVFYSVVVTQKEETVHGRTYVGRGESKACKLAMTECHSTERERTHVYSSSRTRGVPGKPLQRQLQAREDNKTSNSHHGQSELDKDSPPFRQRPDRTFFFFFSTAIMGETLGISHNVFEKAERERDRKERLKVSSILWTCGGT